MMFTLLVNNFCVLAHFCREKANALEDWQQPIIFKSDEFATWWDDEISSPAKFQVFCCLL